MPLNRSHDLSAGGSPQVPEFCLRPSQGLIVKQQVPAMAKPHDRSRRNGASFFKMGSSVLLVVALGLLHHAGAFPVMAPTCTARGTAPSSVAQIAPKKDEHHHLYARRNSQSNSDESANVDGASSRETQSKPGWRRRVLSRLRRKRGSLEATATPDETSERTHTSVDQFILDNFERLSPEQLFSTLEKSQYVLDAAAEASHPFFESPVELPVVGTNSTEMASFHDFFLEKEGEEFQLLDCAVPVSLIGETSSYEGGPPIRKAVRNWFQNLLTNCFCEWSAEEPQNLQVRCSPTGNAVGQLVRGQLNCNARADFDRLVFDFIRLSGGSIEGSRLALNLLAFTVDRSKQSHDTQPSASAKSSTRSKTPGLWESKKLLPRYQAQFDLHANDCIFKEEDLFESSCVRNGLQNLVKRILKRRGIQTASVVLDGISVQDGKVSVKGEATVGGVIPTRISFEVRSGINFKHRGHVLTFPGLELSVSPEAGFFVPISNVELDIGNNARIRECLLDGEKKQLKVSASVTITPVHTLKLGTAYAQTSDAYSAQFYDVGRWLTRIGRFSL